MRVMACTVRLPRLCQAFLLFLDGNAAHEDPESNDILHNAQYMRRLQHFCPVTATYKSLTMQE